jgi:hypothetical protein
MAATAVIAGVALIGTAASVESSAQTRRLAGQAQDRQKYDMDKAEATKQEGIKQAENQQFSLIQRQRQRAMATGSSVKAGAGSTDAVAATTGTAAPAAGGKTTLGQ